MPGCGDSGPTLEIFSYDALLEKPPAAVNRPGLGHIAFETGDVGEARTEVLANGGQAVGEVVSLTTSAGGRVTWCYVRDPEGNLIELQMWDRPPGLSFRHAEEDRPGPEGAPLSYFP